MLKDGVLNALNEVAPEEGANRNVIKHFNIMEDKSHPNFVLKVGEEPATLVTFFLIKSATTKSVWNKIQDSDQKKTYYQPELMYLTLYHQVRQQRGYAGSQNKIGRIIRFIGSSQRSNV